MELKNCKFESISKVNFDTIIDVRSPKEFTEAKYISMGTTSDFEDAVSVGSNVIRLGESIFGKRL